MGCFFFGYLYIFIINNGSILGTNLFWWVNTKFYNSGKIFLLNLNLIIVILLLEYKKLGE